jgi:enterochelin esterase-like enzyme
MMKDHTMDPDKPHPSRRALLRGALGVTSVAAVAALVTACTTSDPAPQETQGNQPSSGTASGTQPLPQELAVIPASFASPAERQGSLVELTYDTFESTTYDQKAQKLTKRAIVYLPYGYTEDDRYNVFYLMHGGWGDETTTVGTPGQPSAMKNTLDHAIAAGEIQPLIIVCPTYNNTSPDDSAEFGLALRLNENYHQELLQDLLPAVEGAYSTYSDDTSPEGLMASRDHRGFGGFSMGAVATWRTFQHALDYFRYYLPMSCGTSLDMDTIVTSAQGRDRADYFVWVITGTDDFAHPYDEDRVALMRESSNFTETDNEQNGNFAFRVKDGYSHNAVAAMEYTYNGLRWFWSA